MKAPRPSALSITMLICLMLSPFFYSCQELEEELIDETNSTGQTAPIPDPDPIPQPITPTTPANPNSVPGPMEPVSSIPYSQITNKEYVIELDRWDIPNDRKEAVKTTDNIQAAIDWAASEGFGIIRLPAGHYLVGKYGNAVYQAGIELPSNTAFLLDKNATIEMAANDKWNYCAITVTKQKNVLISGGTVIGDKTGHTYTPRTSDGKTNHDEGHCICIQTLSENVTVENMVLKEATGDGVFLIAQDIKNKDIAQVKNIIIQHNNIGYNRRQGISVVGAANVIIKDNEIHHTKGIAPEHGIDIESHPYKSNDIAISSNYFHNNEGHILNFDGVDTIIEDNFMEQGDDIAQHIGPPVTSWNKANVTFRNNTLSIRNDTRVSNSNGFIFYAYDISGPNTRINAIYGNTFIKCGIAMLGQESAIIRDNDFDFGHIVVQNMDDIKIFNNTLTHDNECWPFRLKNVKGLARGNMYNGKAAIGLDLKEDVLFSGACQEKE